MKQLQIVLLAVVLTARLGTINFNGHKETYYNLPMDKVCTEAKYHGITGTYWERSDGCKMYGKYIICAANYNRHPYGSLIETSRGTAIVLDTGTFEDRSIVDLATTW